MKQIDFDMPAYYRYWGKATKGDSEQLRCHLLPYHCLDVAAVGCILLQRHHHLRQQLARLAGMDEKIFVHWMPFFLALHDLGKFADGFQNLRPDILEALQQRESDATYGRRHDVLGYYLWREHILQHFHELGILKKSHPRIKPACEKSANIWMRSVTGHHGIPPAKQDFILVDYMNPPDDVEAAKCFIADLANLLLGDNRQFPDLDEMAADFSSWWIAGFTVLCDWLGSGRETDEFCSEYRSLAEYWDDATSWAENVIEKNGLIPTKFSSGFSLQDFFAKKSMVKATPLQVEADNIQLGEGTQLFILEDVTGAGKTEAAIILLHRIMSQGLAEGVYFGLPTMATSNSMYRRMSQVYRKLYSPGSHPSCVLAHSARKMSKEFSDAINAIPDEEPQEHGDSTSCASAYCNAWLADNRKKALLAEIGVGTIDQVLLAALPSKHQSLRMVGMLGKVLLFDEIHSVDAYMNTLLCQLLYIHAAAGGSAILLSATLPQNQRSQLIQAFAKGLQQPAPQLEKTEGNHYPLLTHYGKNLFTEKVLATRESVRRSVTVKFIYDESEANKLLRQESTKGKCICWIRNTVKDARRAFKTLKQEMPEIDCRLFHARYALDDRLEIENKVLNQFGPESGSTERTGRALISSPVLQESLDLCFDTMITDITVIDLIIQRCGRLQRHTRDEKGERIDGSDQRGGAVLYVLVPPWTETPDKEWLSSTMKGTAAIYQDSDIWLTQRRLQQNKGIFRMPEDARSLIEAVYSNEAMDEIPEGLMDSAIDAEGERYSEVSLAKHHMLKFDEGYKDESVNLWRDEASTPTRLGEESVSVYLARWQDGELQPWIEAGDYRWARSAVSIMRKKIANEGEYQEIPQEVLTQAKEELPAKGAWGVLLPLLPCGDGLWKGQAKDEKNRDVVFYYSIEAGLMEEEEVQEP